MLSKLYRTSAVISRTGLHKVHSPRLSQQYQRRHYFEVIQSAIQGGIASAQAFTQLPWWATIAASTVVVRLSLFPLVRSQIIMGRKLGGAIPELNFLYQLLRQRLATTTGDKKETMKVLSIFFKGVGACFRLHEVKPLQLIALPLVNLGIFITFIVSIRDMITGDHDFDMFSEELFWFESLEEKDKTMILPLTAIGLSYAAMELSFSTGVASRLILLIKDFLQCGFIIFLPFVAPLPAGIFFYWIPNSLIGMAQTVMLRRAFFQKLFRIPPVIKPAAASVTATATATTTATATATAATVASTATAPAAASSVAGGAGVGSVLKSAVPPPV